MRVLIADGAETVRSALRLLLELRLTQVEIVEAQSVEDVERHAQDGPIDIALIDWDLRVGGGRDAIKALRQKQPKVPTIVLSGRPEVRQEAPAAKADAFVSKGDPPEKLLSTLNALVRGAAGTRHSCAHSAARFPTHQTLLCVLL